MTPDLAELRRLLADGTPGPWSTVSGAGNVWHFRDEGAPTVVAGHQCAAPRVPDALLIAAAVNALPALLDAAEERDALRAERDALAEKVEGLECVLAGAGVCIECYANGWHKLDCSRRRIRRALDGEASHE